MSVVREQNPWCSLIALSVLTLATPCCAPPQPPDAPPTVSTVDSSGSATLVLYFPNRRYIESGDESLPRLLTETRRVEMDPADRTAVARAALIALQAGPSTSSATAALPPRVKVRAVEIRDTTARVDFARLGLSGGSLEEQLMVQAVVQTLAATSGVRSVQFLVEGSIVETLMGHVDTGHPITAEQ